MVHVTGWGYRSSNCYGDTTEISNKAVHTLCSAFRKCWWSGPVSRQGTAVGGLAPAFGVEHGPIEDDLVAALALEDVEDARIERSSRPDAGRERT